MGVEGSRRYRFEFDPSWGENVTESFKSLPGMHEELGSIPSTMKNKNKEKSMKKHARSSIPARGRQRQGDQELTINLSN